MARRAFSWVSPGRWPSLLVAIAVLIAMFLLSGIILVISVRLLGGLEAHHDAWRAAWPWLLAWRLSLYAALVLVWWRKVRPRTVARLHRDHDDGRQSLAKLRRLELMALGILVLLEVINLVNQLGGS
ncbi:type VI protein secretion system component VasK [Halomonas campaniensis]|uniref:Type VI protein secretion system component VasK n=1 Tax=Halomonas campaniensis TaxID=213554 RepID=A0A7W5PCD3_9GAMM|nr:hypothetical protein [Halomonas campaniensis]MBB3332708.1 type VI protein secretion system component VasK [Halomonas campaniensis]